MAKVKILIADDQDDVHKALRLLFRKENFETVSVFSYEKTVDVIRANDVDLVLMDMNYVRGETSGRQGLELLAQITELDKTLPVIVMTAWGSIELAVEAMRNGARDFVLKPWENERLLSIIHNQLELARALKSNQRFQQQISDMAQEQKRDFIAESPAMAPVLDTIDSVASSDANILITGENGSGKGVVAKVIHAASGRNQQAMISVNTASIPESVFESELFGHVAGAFTDARADRMGRFQLADEGTLFLDEIATIPVNLQPKLLRVLEDGQFEPIGSSKTCHVDVRVISATNANIDDEVKNGSFRRDLLYRLNTIHIHLPPLRERREDIIPLANHFLAGYRSKYRKDIEGFEQNVVDFMLKYQWPGNIRELDHAIERAVLMAKGTIITLKDIALKASGESGPDFAHMTLEEMELWAIKNAMAKHDGDISKVAGVLGLSRAALYRRIEKYQFNEI